LTSIPPQNAPTVSFLRPLPPGMTTVTVAKTLTTVALRMPYVFLSTIARGLNTSVGHLGGLFGLAELVGLAVFLIGRSIDRGSYRIWLLSGLASITAGLTLMTVSLTAPHFALGFAGVTLGVAVYTAAGHSWIGHEVPFERRGRFIGLFETSWAMGLLLGAPAVGLLIAATNWRTPWGVIALGFVPLGYGVIRAFPPRRVNDEANGNRPSFHFDQAVLLTLATAFLASFGASGIFATYGAWLADRFGLSVRTIGLLSIAIGGAELVASTSTVRFSDHWGTSRSAIRGFALMTVGAFAVAVTPGVSALGVAALVLVFLGFEFGFICVLSIVTEVGGDNRGTVVTVNAAFMTIARAASAALGTKIYADRGMPASAAMTMACGVTAVVCLSIATRNIPRESRAKTASST
jgi:MFS transporter, DHA1 family, inner membrane transport protein